MSLSEIDYCVVLRLQERIAEICKAQQHLKCCLASRAFAFSTELLANMHFEKEIAETKDLRRQETREEKKAISENRALMEKKALAEQKSPRRELSQKRKSKKPWRRKRSSQITAQRCHPRRAIDTYTKPSLCSKMATKTVSSGQRRSPSDSVFGTRNQVIDLHAEMRKIEQ
jgi:hypothetical protein